MLASIFYRASADDFEAQLELGAGGRVLQPRYGSALQALIAGRVMSHVREVLGRRSAGYSAVSAAHANSTCQALKLMSAAAGPQSMRELAADALEQFINMQHTRVFAYMPLRVPILRRYLH